MIMIMISLVLSDEGSRNGTLIAITWSPITKYLITIKWSQNI